MYTLLITIQSKDCSLKDSCIGFLEVYVNLNILFFMQQEDSSTLTAVLFV